MAVTETFDALLKIVIIGDSGAGKTCLILRYTQDNFRANFLSTIGKPSKTLTLSPGGAGSPEAWCLGSFTRLESELEESSTYVLVWKRHSRFYPGSRLALFRGLLECSCCAPMSQRHGSLSPSLYKVVCLSFYKVV